ncbi:hypothetical protein PbB2_02079 [Candidatus Phycosocius bacilliformis]|uniref:Uncharacterized protein n=1 Tax=Candidatus Phycosocius bacilliformis TaxID=1445552 RepID=A0A2P2EBF2_9PROT|nr:hypothetical protein PbB2_02079 [Candidatus Phycosocius bacilliformis]
MFMPDICAGAYGGVTIPIYGTSVSFVRSNPRAFQFYLRGAKFGQMGTIWGPNFCSRFGSQLSY